MMSAAQYLLDHLVGGSEQCGGNHQPKTVGCLQVDNQFERRRLRHRQIGWVSPFENTTDIASALPHRHGNAGTVADQTAVNWELASIVDCRQSGTGRQ